MSTILLIAWVALLVASYVTAVALLKKMKMY